MGIRIIIADDYPAIRRILCDEMESHPDMEIIGEAENGKDAIECCLSLMPDIALIDVHMPEMNGIEATHQIVSQLPQVKVLAFSGNSDLQYVRAMLKAGASGFVAKDFLPEELVKAIRIIAKGGTYLSVKIKCEIISALYDSIEHLTDTEEALLYKLYEGKHIRDIASYLRLSPKKACETFHGLLEKTAESNIKDLVGYVIREGKDCL